METTATKINAILDAISKGIEKRESMAAEAMKTLDNLCTTPEEYKKANLHFGINSYVANYLKRIQAVVMERDLKKAENAIRFHHYQQQKIGAIDDGGDVSLAQAIVANILGDYIESFFS